MNEKKTKKKKKAKWTKFRHKVVRNVAFCLLYPYYKLKFHVKVHKFKEENRRQYLILYNHQTAVDMFFVGMCFKQTIYYVATEDIFSLGWVSKLLSYLVAPIPIKKQSTDVRAVLNCMKVAKEGASIALAPEGNRTYSGRTGYFNPAIVDLALALKLPIAIAKIEGGYGVSPRWSDTVRRGKVSSRIARVIEYEEYSKLGKDEIYELLRESLYVDESVPCGVYKSKHRAEYMERAFYVCPECGLSEFRSSGDAMVCSRCGLTVRYTENKELVSPSPSFKFKSIGEWYDYQTSFINSYDVLADTGKPLYTEKVNLFEEIPYKKKLPIAEDASLSLFGDRLEISYGGKSEVYPFSEVTVVTVLGRNKLNFYHGGRVFQVKGDPRFSALKYMNIYFRYKNLTSEDKNGEFLGI